MADDNDNNDNKEPKVNTGLLPFGNATHEHVADWYFKLDNEYFGPFSKAEIKEGLLNGELSIHLFVSDCLEGPYATLEFHPEFKDLFLELKRLPKFKKTG